MRKITLESLEIGVLNEAIENQMHIVSIEILKLSKEPSPVCKAKITGYQRKLILLDGIKEKINKYNRL
jgi:hypothetical protein